MVKNALTGLFDGGRVRNQTVLTPKEILTPLRDQWGEISLDPCGAEGSLVGAMREIRLPDDGAAAAWEDRTFCNPPYKNLRPWLDYSQPEGRTCWLVPVRPHRRWWRAWASDLDCLIYLDPLRFVGYDQPFPAPLALGFLGEIDPGAFSHLGGVI